jgi:hypothetical protein
MSSPRRHASRGEAGDSDRDDPGEDQRGVQVITGLHDQEAETARGRPQLSGHDAAPGPAIEIRMPVKMPGSADRICTCSRVNALDAPNDPLPRRVQDDNPGRAGCHPPGAGTAPRPPVGQQVSSLIEVVRAGRGSAESVPPPSAAVDRHSTGFS